MTMQNMLLVLLIAFAAVSTQGCATRDRRDAPWDPKPGTNLFDQIPNEINASRRCCGHLKTCQVGQTARC
jgi:hypothetical protein